jgi:hypothetical protein
MPAKIKRTNLSRNSGTMVPSSVASSPKKAKTTGKPKKKKKKTSSSKPVKGNEESHPLEENVEDNMSDVSEDPVDKYNLTDDEEIDDEPRFKYSTAELPDHSSRNTRCCIMAMCVLCIIVAIAVSFVMVKIPQKKDEERAAEAPSPTAPPPTANGLGMFTSTKETVVTLVPNNVTKHARTLIVAIPP